MPIGQVQSNTDNESKLVATSGGSAANFAVWLATLQIETHLFARVGKGDGKKMPCRFFAEHGTCRFGDKCYRSHDVENKTEEEEEQEEGEAPEVAPKARPKPRRNR